MCSNPYTTSSGDKLQTSVNIKKWLRPVGLPVLKTVYKIVCWKMDYSNISSQDMKVQTSKSWNYAWEKYCSSPYSQTSSKLESNLTMCTDKN